MPKSKKRHHANEEAASAKKSRTDNGASGNMESTSTMAVQDDPKKKRQKRKRTRCKMKCYDAVQKMTRALRTDPSPIGHLFTSVDDSGIPYASLSDMIPILSLDPDLLRIPVAATVLLNTNPALFRVERSDEDGLLVKHMPVQWSVAECTVYIDRLPLPRSSSLVHRLCSKFGTVVDVRLPLKRPLPPPSTATFTRNPQPKAFAFVQFSTRDEAISFCEEYKFNDPALTGFRSRWYFNKGKKYSAFSSGKRVHLGKFRTRAEALRTLRPMKRLQLKQRMEFRLRQKLRVEAWRKALREERRKAARRKRRRLDRQKRGKKSLPDEHSTAQETPMKSRPPSRKRNRDRGRHGTPLPKNARRQVKGDQRESSVANTRKKNGEKEQEGETEKKKNKKNKKKRSVESVAMELDVMQEGGSTREAPSTPAPDPASVPPPPPPPDPSPLNRRRRPKRTDGIRCSLARHFCDIQAIPFSEYERLRHEYLGEKTVHRKEAISIPEQASFKAKQRNHLRDELRDALWSVKEGGNEEGD